MFAIIVEALESWYLLDELKGYHVIEENQCLAIREYVSQIAKHIDRIEIEDGVYHTSDGLHRAVHIIHILADDKQTDHYQIECQCLCNTMHELTQAESLSVY